MTIPEEVGHVPYWVGQEVAVWFRRYGRVASQIIVGERERGRERERAREREKEKERTRARAREKDRKREKARERE
jgi:hypothetical protein